MMMRVLFAFLLIVVCGARTVPLREAAAAQEQGVSDEAMALVVAITGDIGSESSRFGAGIIVGASTTDVYIVTANHVLRKTPHEVASDIRVEFRGLPKQRFPATLSNFDDGADVAVVLVRKVPQVARYVQGLRYEHLASRAEINRLQPADPVYWIGNAYGGGVKPSLTPDRVRSKDAQSIKIVSALVQPGVSGGPLLSPSMNVLGIFFTDDNGTDEGVVRMDVVLDLLGRWQVPVLLRVPTVAPDVSAPSVIQSPPRVPGPASALKPLMTATMTPGLIRVEPQEHSDAGDEQAARGVSDILRQNHFDAHYEDDESVDTDVRVTVHWEAGGSKATEWDTTLDATVFWNGRSNRQDFSTTKTVPLNGNSVDHARDMSLALATKDLVKQMQELLEQLGQRAK